MRVQALPPLLLLIAISACAPPVPDGAPESGLFAVGADDLYYESLGAGYPVVLVGGGSGMDLRQWDAVFPSLAESFQVIRYDPRGVGRSDNPTEAYSDADDLAALVEHLGFKSVVAVGESSAGGIALQFAASHPDRATAVVAAAPVLEGSDVRRLGELRLPVLLLAGELDDPEVLRRNEVLKREIAGSVERRIPRAGPNAPLEHPEAFIDAVVPFLRRVLPVGR